MTARHTPWTTLLVSLVIGLLSGGLLALLTHSSGLNLLGTTPIVPIVLLLLALLVLLLSWQVRRYVKGKNKKYDIRRAAPTLVSAKALEVVGSLLAGWYLGQLAIVALHPASGWAKRVMVECGVAATAAVVDLVAGLVGEWWCTLPPGGGAGRAHKARARSDEAAAKAQSTAPRSASSAPARRGMQE